ncbi:MULTISPECIES: SRPBCC domain-containing protein [unclassified Rhizobium]|uniref:SRPBCC domain-containing protein n=1 Tax=unclassified Rhizobium TaxID=2613769 RepID=UPI0038027748
MAYEFSVNARIGRPVPEVFDAVVNPEKLSGYFVTTGGGASAPLIEGTTVIWWGDVPVEVETIEKNRRVLLRWRANSARAEADYQTKIEMRFEPLDDGATMVTIREGIWRTEDAGLKQSYINCEGWTQMLCCLKAFAEYGINLREGYYTSEMKGVPARPRD